MEEQPNKNLIVESWSENLTYWFPKWRSLLSPPVLLTVGMAVCVVLTAWNSSVNGRTRFALVLLSACGYSFPALMAILASVMGGYRLCIAAIFLVLLNGFIGAVGVNSPVYRLSATTILLPVLIAIAILLTLASIKLFWGTFRNIQLNHQPLAEGVKFKIKDLFIATAALAIVIAITQMFAISFPSTVQEFFYQEGLYFALLTFLSSANALVSVWAILGKSINARWFVSLVVAIVLLLVSMAAINSILIPVDGYFLAWWIGITALSWTTTTLQMYLLRREGYRFVRYEK